MKKKLLFGLILLLVLLSCAVFVGCKSPKALPAPQNVEFVDRLLTWDKVDGAIGYAVLVGDTEYETADTSFAVVDITAGYYTLGVIAIGDGDKYLNSQTSETISFNLLPGVESGSDEIGWFYTMLEDGTGYEVYRGENRDLINHPHIKGDIKIPDFFGDYPVKRISELCFYVDSPTLVYLKSFTNCNTTTTGVELPKYLESIGNNAFNSCVALESIYIPDGVVIEHGAFVQCISLKNVRLPGDLVEIKSNTFVDTGLDSIELPPTLEKIGPCAFYWGNNDDIEEMDVESQLSSLVIPASVKSIEVKAFKGRENLRDITILSTNLEFFKAEVFANTAWEQAQPDGWTYLREDILYGYKGEMPADTTLTVPSGVKYIAGGAFNGCSNLKKIVLPDGVKLVGEATFNGCTALEEVVLPKDLPNVPENTFNNCTSLKDVSFFWDVFDGDYLGMMFYGCTAIEEVTIPTGIKTLNYTFWYCTGLKKVTLPEGIETLIDTFSGCTSLKEITLPEGIETLDGTFSGCTSLKEITLPSTLKVIESETFTSSGLISIILPKSLEKIGNSPFRLCNDLKSIYYEGTFDEFKGLILNYDRFLQVQPVGSTVYYYSETKPTTAGNYWHYVDGQAVVWKTATETTALQQKTTQYTFAQLPAVVKEEN